MKGLSRTFFSTGLAERSFFLAGSLACPKPRKSTNRPSGLRGPLGTTPNLPGRQSHTTLLKLLNSDFHTFLSTAFCLLSVKLGLPQSITLVSLKLPTMVLSETPAKAGWAL